MRRQHSTNRIQKKIQGTVAINEALENASSQLLDKQIMTAELLLVMLAAKHNLHFLIFEHLKCSRTKSILLLNNKIGLFAQAAIAEKLKKTHFVLL